MGQQTLTLWQGEKVTTREGRISQWRAQDGRRGGTQQHKGTEGQVTALSSAAQVSEPWQGPVQEAEVLRVELEAGAWSSSSPALACLAQDGGHGVRVGGCHC